MSTLEQRIVDLTTRLGTESKSLRTLLNGNQTDLSALTFGTKQNLVSSLNELKVLIANATSINDAAASTTSTYSSQKTLDSIAAAIAAVVGGAPAAFDTLQELYAQLQNDETSLAAVLTALGFRVRVDAAQSFTGPQQIQGRQNIGAQEAAAIGNTDRDFVAAFNSALV